MSSAIKPVLKAAATRLIGEYRINWIVASPAPGAAVPELPLVPVDPELCRQLDRSSNEQMRKATTYARDGLPGFAIAPAGKPICVVHFAAPDQYDRKSTWPLRSNELALVDITTDPDHWGQGHAVRLIRAATAYFLARGTARCIAFIWWSNRPSLRAFEKAGWRRIALCLEIQINGQWRALRLPLPGRG